MMEIEDELVDAGIDKPAEKGLDLYNSGFITLCEYSVIRNKIIFLANCEASYNPQIYYPQVCIDLNDGKITASTCTCEASETGLCTHVSCLLHLVLDLVKQKKPNISRPCTSKVFIHSISTI